MQTALFDYDLPPALIAQQPAEPRDSSRLLVLHRATGAIEHRYFRDVGDYLHTGDLLVANNSRVIPARLHGRKPTGGLVEVFLLRQVDGAGAEWECLVRGKGLTVGVTILLEAKTAPVTATPQSSIFNLQSSIVAVHESGTRTVRFSAPIRPYLDQLGELPLPPYITQYAGESERYQTIYSQPEGSAAAPTAGLHFTPELLSQLQEKGVGFDTVTLHVGMDTFKPVTAEQIADHQIHSEQAELSAATAQRINETTQQGGRIVAVGTTSTRTLEWAAAQVRNAHQMRSAEYEVRNEEASPYLAQLFIPHSERVVAFAGNVNLFIYPGYRFQAVDALITNFHLPKSSLLMLVSAFIGQAHVDDVDAGRRMLLATYEVAKREGYRFFSFGDAMLIIDS